MNKLLTLVAALLLLSSVSFAAPAAPPPDASANPVLAPLAKAGAKFFYLGKRAGLDGWFIVSNGQVQIAYTTADNKNALIGALLGESGENITAIQVAKLVQTNPDVAALISSAQKEQMAIAQAGSPDKPASAPSAGAMPSAPLSPGERLFHDLSTASTVVIGNPQSPEILMVMDTHCTHCQATWKVFRDSVMKGTVHIRMIPIGATGGDDERAAAVLLGATDPLSVWDKYVAGDKSQLAGVPSAAALEAVRSNAGVIANWKIDRTPYLVYRAKDGTIKVVRGEPDKVTLVLSDIGL